MTAETDADDVHYDIIYPSAIPFVLVHLGCFAAIWTGWWRSRWAFWLAMPIIGVLLGLALASKWVAAYAIGALICLVPDLRIERALAGRKE